MIGTPKVSVIIPVYNTERYLRKCLDSVINQTLRDIEVICIDDGSTDGSLNILREYQSKDERITILRQEKSNAGAARNLGLSIAKGEYLSFLDSDDFFEPMMLEHMYVCAKNRNAEIVVCEMMLYMEDSGETVPVNWHIKKGLLPAKKRFSFYDIKSDAFRCIMSYVWDKLIKRDVVIKNGLRFQSQPLYNDAVFAYSAMMSANAITVLKEYLVYNRIRSSKDSITDTRYLHIDCAYSVLIGLKEYLMSKNIYAQYQRDFLCYAISLIFHTCMAPNNNTTSEMLHKADLWMDEFEVKGHEPDYYYDILTYQRLLQAIGSQCASAELARLQPELSRLDSSLYRIIRDIRTNGFQSYLDNTLLFMVVRYIKVKGFRFTFRKIYKKVHKVITDVRDE